jgi:replicative DNA helicase
LDDALLVVLPTLAEDPLFKDAPNLQGIDLKNITKQDLDKLELTQEQTSKVIQALWEDRSLASSVSDLTNATDTAIRATARAYDDATGKTVGAAVIAALTPQTITQAAQDLAE